MLRTLTPLACTAVAVLAFVLAGCAAGLPASEEARTPIEVIENHDLGKDEAYTRLRRWAAETYNSANDVLQMDDREAGTLVLQGAAMVSPQPGTPQVPVRYTMTIDVRDDRLRFRQVIGEIEEFAYLSRQAADRMTEEFALLRASAMAALAEDDDF